MHYAGEIAQYKARLFAPSVKKIFISIHFRSKYYKNIADKVIICFYSQAEARAEFAERSVQKLQKEVDRLEGVYSIILLLKIIILRTKGSS